MELKNIAILGPRGNVGAAIISELLKYPEINITGITRSTSNYTPPDPRITVKGVDYDSAAALTEVFTGQDAIVNCLTGGATQYGPSKIIINAAVAAGSVKLFFANEFVGNLETEQYRRLPEAAVGAKLRVRRDLEQLAQQGALTWTSLNGGPFFDMWVMKGPAGFDVKNRRARIYGSGENPLSWTPLPVIAQAAVAMLRAPEPIRNRPVHIAPIPGLTQRAILRVLEERLGKFEVVNVDVEKINRHAKVALERGEVGKAMKGLALSNQFYEGDCANDLSGLAENDLVGVQQMSVEDAVSMAIETWGLDGDVVQGMYEVEACEI